MSPLDDGRETLARRPRSRGKRGRCPNGGKCNTGSENGQCTKCGKSKKCVIGGGNCNKLGKGCRCDKCGECRKCGKCGKLCKCGTSLCRKGGACNKLGKDRDCDKCGKASVNVPKCCHNPHTGGQIPKVTFTGATTDPCLPITEAEFVKKGRDELGITNGKGMTKTKECLITYGNIEAKGQGVVMSATGAVRYPVWRVPPDGVGRWCIFSLLPDLRTR